MALLVLRHLCVSPSGLQILYASPRAALALGGLAYPGLLCCGPLGRRSQMILGQRGAGARRRPAGHRRWVILLLAQFVFQVGFLYSLFFAKRQSYFLLKEPCHDESTANAPS